MKRSPSRDLGTYAGVTRDMVPHLETLSRLASEAKSVTELGVRSGVSTWALLDGLPPDGVLWSVDLAQHSAPERVTSDPRWSFFRGDSLLTGGSLGLSDLVFVDTSHTYEQTRDELRLAADALEAKVIALHDALWTGVARATFEYLAERPEWRVVEFWPAGEARKSGWRDYSLVVLRRAEEEEER
jgi:predicted O-methyltransferase YrrM